MPGFQYFQRSNGCIPKFGGEHKRDVSHFLLWFKCRILKCIIQGSSQNWCEALNAFAALSSISKCTHSAYSTSHQFCEEPIVKRKTKLGTANSNALNGYRAIEICSPMEVQDEKTEHN